jgi:hypothetical protein
MPLLVIEHALDRQMGLAGIRRPQDRDQSRSGAQRCHDEKVRSRAAIKRGGPETGARIGEAGSPKTIRRASEFSVYLPVPPYHKFQQGDEADHVRGTTETWIVYERLLYSDRSVGRASQY